ncbi:MAG: hypothetical protein FD161_445 [Limisphaerales bacterium]|nr:MAG: hypothetical protein FD161_445 [Limisphaerales bacterium]KAG0510350.1 MAG: hypothetical protein E1N63_445 [Limisphaerales bacterium]TXT51537.1 MAG: hypothetical protein FD140_1575 [Limisphaerales bacterium]
MPITGPGSFVPCLNLFLPHYEQVNTTLGAGGPLVLRNPNGPVPPTLNRANLETWRNDLQTQHTAIEGQINDWEIAGADLMDMKVALHLRAGQFNEKVRSQLAGTHFERALPVLPSPTDGQALFMKPMDDISTLWAKINAAVGIPGFTAPLLLMGGYTLAEFDTALGLLRGQFPTTTRAEFLVSYKIEERNAIQKLVYPTLKAYRLAVPTFFAADSPLVLTLPKLTPDPGSTPDPVNATGIWNAPTTQAKITWTLSPAADLEKYEIRWSPGSTYQSENEVVIGTVAAGGTLEFFTAQGLGQVGAVSVFKVYVLTTTGNERGSNVVKITRP